MTEEDLISIGMTREEWDAIITEERAYELRWASKVDRSKL